MLRRSEVSVLQRSEVTVLQRSEVSVLQGLEYYIGESATEMCYRVELICLLVGWLVC